MHREEEDDDEIDVPMMLRYAVFRLDRLVFLQSN